MANLELLLKLVEAQQAKSKQQNEILKAMMSSSAEKAVKKRFDAYAEQTPTEQLLPYTQTAQDLKDEAQEEANPQIEPKPIEQNPGEQQLQYETKPASSPFGLGGLTMQDGKFTEQKAGILGAILGAIFTGTPNPGARMAEKTLARLIGLQQGKSKGVYGFDPVSGKVTLQAEVPEGADVRNMQSQTGLETLPIEQQTAAYGLARKIAGVRGAEKLLPSIVSGLKSGKTIDQIEDEQRFAGQSKGFTGDIRSAAQQIMVGKSSNEQQTAFDTLDDLQAEPEQQKEFLKRMAVVNAPVDQRNQIMGKERTIGLLDEIQGDLDTLEKNGISTGFLSGNLEGLLARVGQVKSPEMRKVATKIAVAVINYRRAMTGVQFGQIENREYKILFPGINKIGRFNKSSIEGLKEVFNGDVDTFYQQSMGKKNYDKIFNEQQFPAGLNPDEWEEVK